MGERGAAPQLSALVNQFADPYAFIRELVQNSIDAGSNEIDVETRYDAGGATRRSACRTTATAWIGASSRHG